MIFERLRRMMLLIIGGVAVAVPAIVGAASQGPLTIASLGSHGATGYVNFTAPLAESCNWNNIYFSVSDTSGQATLSLLMTAHVSGRPLSRIDYTRDVQGTCWITLVQI